jgi:hypothetical protein
MFRAIGLTLLMGISLSFSLLNAQIDMPQPSPLATLNQKIGLMDANITYSRPSARGRKVFGELVPYGKLWRTGANKASFIEFTDSVKIAGISVKKGKYAIFTIPNVDEWTIVLNSDWNQSGTSKYDESKNVVNIKVKPSIIPFSETFTIDFNYLTTNSAQVEISWETSKVSFGVETSVDEAVMRNIKNALNISAGSYFQAARYYYDTNRELATALEWINKSISMEERYWVVRYKALIEAKMGDFKSALKSAKRGLDLAKEAGSDDYVRLNEASIQEWSKK